MYVTIIVKKKLIKKKKKERKTTAKIGTNVRADGFNAGLG
jgi:hypothetical protein